VITVAAALFGGLVGALVSLIVSFMVEQRRLRGDVAVSVVEWLQGTYRHLAGCGRTRCEGRIVAA
jgi:hypothetical protein